MTDEQRLAEIRVRSKEFDSYKPAREDLTFLLAMVDKLRSDNWFLNQASREDIEKEQAYMRRLTRQDNEINSLRATIQRLEQDRGLWSCPDCGFAFAIEHTPDIGSDKATCPACAELRLEAEALTLRMALRDIYERTIGADPAHHGESPPECPHCLEAWGIAGETLANTDAGRKVLDDMRRKDEEIRELKNAKVAALKIIRRKDEQIAKMRPVVEAARAVTRTRQRGTASFNDAMYELDKALEALEGGAGE